VAQYFRLYIWKTVGHIFWSIKNKVHIYLCWQWILNCLIFFIVCRTKHSLDMDPTSADSHKSSRRRRTKAGKKPDGSNASHASSSSAGSSLSSSRVSTPSLATNASSTSVGAPAALSSSNTSALSDLRQKFFYDRVRAQMMFSEIQLFLPVFRRFVFVFYL